MESSTIETKFQSLLSLDRDVTDPKLELVLLIHTVNLAYDLKCTGLNEDDPEIEKDLPSNWKKDVEGIYSFRYYNPKDKNIIYLKIVIEEDLVSVNAVTAAKNDELLSTEFKLFDYPELDSENINKIYKKYKTELLSKLLNQLQPKQEESKSAENNRRAFGGDQGLLWIPGTGNQYPRIIGDGRNDIYPGPANPFGVPPHGHFPNPRNPNIFPNLYGDQPRPGGQPNVQFDPFGPNGIDPSTPDPDLGLPPRPFGTNPQGPFGGGRTGGPFGGGFSGPGGLI